MRNDRAMIGVLAFVLLFGAGRAAAQDWAQWRGPNRDNHVVGFKAPNAWPKELTKKWKVPVGQGDSSPVLVGDKLYVFGHIGDSEVTQCLDAGTGKEVWKESYTAQAATPPAGGIHAGPRSTPAVADGKVCTLGVRGVLSCLDAASGKPVWRKDTKSYPGFFTSSSPLLLNGLCIVCLGGDKAGEIVAFDLASGDRKWSSKAAAAPYGSPILFTVDGVRQLVAQMPTGGKGKGQMNSLVGIELGEGKQLWKFPFGTGYNDNMATPLVQGSTIIYSAPSGGTLAIKVEQKDGKFTATELWKKSDSAHKYNTPVLHDGMLFGLTSKGKGSAFFCMDTKTGDTLWTDATARGQCGHVLDAGSVLIGLTSDKNLVVFRPDRKGYEELAHYPVADTQPWAAPLVAGNHIYVKDQDSLTLWTIK